MFDNLNALGQNLYCLQGSSPGEVLKQIKQITLPTKIISIYGDSKQHFAWILTTANVEKVVKPKSKEK